MSTQLQVFFGFNHFRESVEKRCNVANNKCDIIFYERYIKDM